MDFKKFVTHKIQYIVSHFKRKAILLEENGEPLFQINLSFNYLTDEFMAKADSLENEQIQMQQSTMKLSNLEGGLIKITDDDLEPLWQYIDESYKLSLNLEGQNVTDKTVLKISQLYQQRKCGFIQLNFAENEKVSQIGCVKLAAALKDNNMITHLNLHGLKLGKNGANRIGQLIVCSGLRNLDLGLIGNQSLAYLATVFGNPHRLITLSFGQDQSDPWKSGKQLFAKIIRLGEFSKQIFSINLYPQNTVKHWQLISQFNILCKKRRLIKVGERQNQFRFTSLNPDHGKFYDPDNHSINAYKFSVKSYLTNVFGSQLDEALYFLEKERRNSLREEAIFKITKQPINKLIMQDICTSDGSIIVLAKYLLGKIKQKKEQN